MMTADCLPVLLCEASGTEVAAAHAGWRGLCEGVLEETVACFRAPPATIQAWLGPAIGPQAFEVGPEVREAFIAKDPRRRALFARTARNISPISIFWRASVSRRWA
ncbi:COG1496: Uncharacterized conserved protein [Cronobacter universalis NCTC 9529]|nr:COG1496: Uncharacterized conserved protein [Cronobacter universalis NCTC 9529]